MLKDFVPPILVNIVRNFRRKAKGLPYGSYEEALKTCKAGYEDDELVNIVFEKTLIYRDVVLHETPFTTDISSLRTIIGLSIASRQKKLSVIDFGGACGAHYFLSKRILGDMVELSWNVVETPNMVAKAKPLEDDNLKFFDSLQTAQDNIGHADLVFSSGALQCTPRPYDSLRSLVNCNADNIFITRVPLSTSYNESYIVQNSKLGDNGPGTLPSGFQDRNVQYPVTFQRKDKFESIILERYSLVLQLDEDKASYESRDECFDMYGYFGRLKS